MTINSTALEMNIGGNIPLQSSKSTLRLEQIAALRASGIGDHVGLPQLVVCGDQSAGKSSILEGLTGIPFPRQDGVCTKFATEIILRHTHDEQRIVATIIPRQTRSDSSRGELGKYRKEFQSFKELPAAIEEAGALMGIKGFKVSGNTGLHLTVFDLPGLISVASEEQTEYDVNTVDSLVNSYAENPRTIILAVVQAGNDIANQAIIQKSRRYDKNGQRTVGIITKPDLINKGTENRLALLAKNQDTTKLKLGFFLVKNPTPTELESGITTDQRQKNETRYFRSSPWKEQALHMDRVGIVALRMYLQGLLDYHIEQELPKVRDEIRDLMTQTDQDLNSLGEERSKVADIRKFLTSLSTRFNGLIQSALNGTYHETDSVFFSESTSSRLRARVHRRNAGFSKMMRDHGAKRKVVTEKDVSKDETTGELLVAEEEMKNWVKEVYCYSRGKEIPGNNNHVFLSELFHIQSSMWREIADLHLSDIFDDVMEFSRAALSQITKDEQTLVELQEIASCLARKTELCGGRAREDLGG